MCPLTTGRLIGSSGKTLPCTLNNSLDAGDYSRIGGKMQDEKMKKPQNKSKTIFRSKGRNIEVDGAGKSTGRKRDRIETRFPRNMGQGSPAT
jgi:hypothetical protein